MVADKSVWEQLMNELQMVLLIFAILVVGVLFILNKNKKSKQNADAALNKQARQGHNPSTQLDVSQVDASQSSNNLGEPWLSATIKSDSRLDENYHDEIEEVVPENQGRLAFGKDFDSDESSIKNGTRIDESDLDVETNPKHYITYEDSSEKTLNADAETPVIMAEKPTLSKEDGKTLKAETPLPEIKEPKVFVIILMGSKEFNMADLNKSFLGMGLVHSEQGVYVKKNTQGKEYIHIANILEPGIFPEASSEGFDSFKIQGIALILALPTYVKAPAAMNDMVDIARKISQKFNARLYDGERRLLKESEIQAMRDTAISYEATEVVN